MASEITISQNPSVVVIGAGVAGIAAASRLHENGITDVKILEAGERIGGRIYSVLFGNGYVDLGADRCYGETSNIVYELVKDCDLLKRPPEVFPDLYHSTRKLIEPKFKDELYQIYTEVYNEDRQGVHGSRSLGEHVTKRFFETIIQTWDSNNEKFLVASESIDLFHKWVLSHEGATSWFNVATKSDFEKIKGNQHLHWNGVGFKTIFDVLMKKSPDLEHNILLYKEVNEIEWNVSDKTIVSCLDGSTYQADHVILTVSLGVLKDKYSTLFTPQLETSKIYAIKELGMGTVTKMFLRFRNSWWNEDFAGYSFLWDEQDLEKPGMFFDGPIKNGKSWITSILAILPVPNNPEVLEVWFTGEFVMEIEKCTSDTIINGIMFVLSVFEVCDFGDLIRPYQILRHNWNTNTHFRGTHSYQAARVKSEQRTLIDHLCQPLVNRAGRLSVLFAGEATHPTHFSTVHGAIESGFREADRLISMYQ